MAEGKDILIELSLISSTVAELPKKPVFTVPPTYFLEFPEKLLKRIHELEEMDTKSELEQISPLLASLSKKMPFTVPQEYFSNLEPQFTRTVEQAPARVVKMHQLGKLRFMYAAAAVTAILGFFTWFFILNNPVDPPALSKVDIRAELPKLSDSEIDSYLTTMPESIQVDPLSLAGIEDVNLEDLMDNIKEDELLQFINEDPMMKTEDMN